MNTLTHRNLRTRAHRRGFSLIEMLIALTITATLLTAALSALDTAFKSYKFTTDSASTHVVSRIVVHRINSIVRNGVEFGPEMPEDFLPETDPPFESDHLTFVAREDEENLIRVIGRVERREVDDLNDGPFALWYEEETYTNGTLTASEERPLLTGLLAATFFLRYDDLGVVSSITTDLTIKPNDFRESIAIHAGNLGDAPIIRLVSTINPRRIEYDD